MDFKETFEVVSRILDNIGSKVQVSDYDGIIVKKLEASNTLDKGRTTKQSHIAITGAQMDMFPYVRADGYFEVNYENEDPELKKYFVAQIPVFLHKENVTYLDSDANLFKEDVKMVHVSIVRSRRKDAADQIQMSMTYMDSPEYIEYRRIVHAGSFMIMLKRKSELKYDMFSVKGEDADLDDIALKNINNCFTKLPTNTLVHIDELLNIDSDTNDEAECNNEYEEAAHMLLQYQAETGFEIPVSQEDIDACRQEFMDRYAPEKLASLSGNDLLKGIFYTSGDNSEALCYWLERNGDCRSYFGGIAGGSAYKFGLFQKSDTGIWMTGSAQKPKELTDGEALTVGTAIRDALLKGVEIIDTADLDSLETYEKLDDDLKEQVGEQYYNWAWFHKYFAMVFPNKLSCYHNNDWQNHILYGCGIKPSSKYYARSGQISMVENYANLSYRQFFFLAYEKFGKPKSFIRIGTSDDEKSYISEWSQHSVVGIGWKELGSLEDYISGDGLDKSAIADILYINYYPDDKRTASRKAGELIRFYNTDQDTVFVPMNGQKLVAFADEVGSYFFDVNSNMCHHKPAKWQMKFADGEVLPVNTEGLRTSCYQITNEENLMYLYKKYYFDSEVGDLDMLGEDVQAYIPIAFKTNIDIDKERNRIVFGAPGTGKSFMLKEDCENLMRDTDGTYERVTFHPDYTYSQFVGTYKPVMDNDGKSIRYDFVPGPFMRVYVDALKSGRTENPQPHLLLIEEINRAKVAAVFGDVFQLLDRDEDGVSEYEIQASEDIRRYLVKELGGSAENYQRIRIPNNMFIWATMNSADQGVFPMDTAFKRRWSFEYLGINENEEQITGKGKIILAGSDEPVEWNMLRKAINNKMSSSDFKINEDKLMGPFFLSKKVMESDETGMIIDPQKFVKAFKSKVIMYLYEDAVKQGKHRFFDGCSDTSKYSSVCEAFDEIGISIFGSTFREDFYNTEKDD